MYLPTAMAREHYLSNHLVFLLPRVAGDVELLAAGEAARFEAGEGDFEALPAVGALLAGDAPPLAGAAVVCTGVAPAAAFFRPTARVTRMSCTKTTAANTPPTTHAQLSPAQARRRMIESGAEPGVRGTTVLPAPRTQLRMVMVGRSQ